MNSNEFIEFENDLTIESSNWREYLLEEASTFREDISNKFNEITINNDSDEEIDSSDQMIPSSNEVLNYLNKIERFIIRETPEMFLNLNLVKNAVVEWKLKKDNKIQTITDYFTKN